MLHNRGRAEGNHRRLLSSGERGVSTVRLARSTPFATPHLYHLGSGLVRFVERLIGNGCEIEIGPLWVRVFWGEFAWHDVGFGRGKAGEKSLNRPLASTSLSSMILSI